ncbi:MAG: cell envelope integrity EipB family protein [Alphaproteobacteria bacterium]|nr:cell envelope integrity EipB family protein [Alphaproteobacteria bacterium]
MSALRLKMGAAAALLTVAMPLSATAVDVEPHRAVYKMTLERATSASGVVGAHGTMLYQWADSCDGWTIEQRYKLRMQYGEQDDAELSISFVTWESKDGTRYRFNVRKLKDGDTTEELRGDAKVPQGAAGEAKFVKPEASALDLPAGTMFPTAHTLALIEAALSGATFLSKQVFDGGTVEGPFEVTGGIGSEHPADPSDKNPLLRKRWWSIRLAFFPADSQSPQPDYELGMDLQDNGIARELVLDYGNFVVRAKLESLEPMPKPHC